MTDDGAGGSTGKTSVGDQCNAAAQFLVGGDGFRGVEHFGHTAALGALVPDKDGITFLNLMVQHGGQAFFLAVEGAGTQNGLVHLFGAGGMLDHGAFGGQVAFEYGNGTVHADGLVIGMDDVLTGDMAAVTLVELSQPAFAALIEAVLFQLGQVFAQRFAGNGHDVQMQVILDLFHDGGHTAGIVEALGRPAAGGTYIQQVTGTAMQAVKGVAGDLDTQFVGDGGQMQQAVGGTGDGSMHQDGVLEAFHGDHAAGAHLFMTGHFHGALPCLAGIGQQVGAGGGHQSAAGQGKAQCFRHDLHGGSGTDEAAGAAAGAGILLGPVQFGLVDFAALKFGAVDAQLFQGEHFGTGIHGAARHHHRGNVHAEQAHQVGRHAFVAAGQIDACVKGSGVGVDFDHVGDDFTAGQAVVDAVRALAFAVADIGAVIPCAMAAGFGNAFANFLHQRAQVATAGMAVTCGALDDDLRLGKILRLPTGADPQRIKLGSQGTHLLTDQTIHEKILAFIQNHKAGYDAVLCGLSDEYCPVHKYIISSWGII